MGLMIILRPLTVKLLPAGWQYRIGKIAIVFFLAPVSLFIKVLTPVLYQPAKQGHYSGISILPATLAERHAGLQNAITALDATMKQHLTIEVIQILSFFWLVGAIGFIAWHLYCYHRFMKSLQVSNVPISGDAIALLSSCKATLNIHNEVTLVQNPTISSPMLVGLRHPMILLPTLNMRENDLRMALLHELTHLKHRDLWIKMLALIAGAVHWFNPFVHILRMVISTWSEFACDEALASKLTHEERIHYGEAILNTLDNRFGMNTAFCSSLRASKEYIKRRLSMMLDVKKTRKITSALAIVTVLAIGGIATVFSASADSSIKRTTTSSLHGETETLAAQQQGTVVEALKITDAENIEHTFSTSGISFDSIKGSDLPMNEGFNVDPTLPPFSPNFDIDKAIADIEAGLIKPLSKDNLPEGISPDSTFTFISSDGTRTNITLD